MPTCNTCKTKPALVTVVIFDALGKEVLRHTRLCQQCLASTRFTATTTSSQPAFDRNAVSAFQAEYF